MSYVFKNVYLNSVSTVVGPYEKNGPLGKMFDKSYKDLYFGKSAQTESISMADSISLTEKKYPHYYAKYMVFDPELYRQFSDANGGSRAENYAGYTGGIDPHPYIDEDGTKYLFWVDSRSQDRICGVKMNNWLQPDWSTFKVLTCCGYYTVEDANTNSSNKVSYELSTSTINEGPVITKRGNNYY